MKQPKKPRYRKQQKQVRHLQGKETRGCKLRFGEYGLRACESFWLTARQLEAGRVAVTRTAKRGGRVWERPFPDKPLTKKPAEVRMGKGKGSPEEWVAEIRAGRILYEITGVEEAVAKKALKNAAAKLPVKCKIVERKDTLV